MRKSVKIIAIILALVCALSLASCFGEDSSKDSGKDTGKDKKETSSSTSANQNDNLNNGACTSHTYGEWQVAQLPTCLSTGLQSRTCTKCATVENKTLPKADHTWSEYNVIKEATCEEAGSRSHTCTVCNKSTTETVAALGHNWNLDNNCTNCSASRYGSKGLLFTLQGANDPYPDTYKVTRGTSLDPNCVIPAEYNGKPVTYIGEDGFSGSDIKSIVIPASVKKIDSQVFWYCEQLESVDFKSGSQLEILEGFLGCTSLRSITVPASVTKVTASAFRECTNLNGVYFDNTVGWYKGYMGDPSSNMADVTDSYANANTLKYVANNYYFFRLTESLPLK